MRTDATSQLSADVETAIRLGWRTAEVYHEPSPAERPKEKPGATLPGHLPGASELSDYELGKSLIAAIQCVVIVGGTAGAIIALAPGGSSTTAALIAIAAGPLGVSWKTVASTLGRGIATAEGPLWDAEVQDAIVVAATHEPHLVER